jgi:hypothetical protein
MKKRVISAWANASTHGVTTYETLLWEDGTMSCNCPGWIYHGRSCKHVTRLATEASKIFQKKLPRHFDREASVEHRDVQFEEERKERTGRLIRF